MDVLIVDDEESVRTTTSIAVEAEGHYTVAVSSIKLADIRLSQDRFDLIFLDLRLGEDNGLVYLKQILKKNPSQLVVIFTAHARIQNAVNATKAGAFDYLSKPFSSEELRGILVKSQAELQRRNKYGKLEEQVQDLKSEVASHQVPTRFDSESIKMQNVLQTVMFAAKSPASVLVLGESGTGKSVLAKTVHENSLVADKPFVTVSCPTLSKELLESQLFGHIKGSFTGAIKDSWGKVHAAQGGTLFLDEIGELPMEIQPKLLRLLQEREYERLGENKTRTSDVRIIAATNQNLEQCIADGTFREDLFYRINVITVTMPSLKDRKEDLKTFATDYLDFFVQQLRKPIKGYSEEALSAILSYDWPGNLRELRNTIERAVILCQTSEIESSLLPDPHSQHETSSADEVTRHESLIGSDISLSEIEEAHIKGVLARHSSLQDVANVLDIDKATLYRKRKKLNL